MYFETCQSRDARPCTYQTPASHFILQLAKDAILQKCHFKSSTQKFC